jgi:Sulfotransferase family
MSASGPLWWRVANAAAGLLQAGRAPGFEAEALLAMARGRARSSDLGESQDQVINGLRMWLDAAAEEGCLSPIGRILVPNLALGWLAARLRFVRHVHANPGIDEQPVRAPIVVVGFPRTGTTLLQRLLSLDPGKRAPRMWELTEPAPPPAGKPDKRLANAKRQVQGMLAIRPDFRAIHRLDAEAPEECVHALPQTFATLQLCMYAPVPSYFSWLMEQDLTPSYHYLRSVYRSLAYGQPERRWVLKAPIHLFALDALLAVFPDACIVHVHRDPARAAASGCSLTAAVRTLAAIPQSPGALGQEWLRVWSIGLDRALRVRDNVRPERFYDVHYDELVRDPAAVVERVLWHFGEEPPADTASTVGTWMAANPPDRYGRHRYTLEQFGLRAEEVHERFAAYMSRFDLAPEGVPAG